MSKKQKRKVYTLAIGMVLIPVVLFAFTGTVAAQPGTGTVTNPKCADGTTPAPGNKCPIENPAPGYLVGDKDFTFGDLLTRAIGWALYFAGGIAVLFLLVGGFQYIAARGNEEATEKAKKTITGAVIGIVIIIMAFAIVTIVNNLVTTPPG